jgi:hypothetical protein
MADSNGLLDLMKSPAAMGLLAAGFGGLAGANRNTPYNNLGRAGLAGIAGYSAADALQQNQAKLDEAERVKKAIPGLYRTGANGQTSFDALEAARMGIDPKLIADYAAVPNAGRAKVKNTIYVPGINGEKVAIQQDEYGGQVGEGRSVYVDPQLVDTGATKQFVTPQAGQSFQVGMSPAELDAQARGWANVGARNEQNEILRDGVDVQRQAQRTQVITMPDGSIQLIDKGTTRAVQPQTPEGKPLPKSPAPTHLTEAEGKGSIYLSQMADASRALGALPAVSPVMVGATGSTWSNWMTPADAQKAAQAQRQWAEPYLRMKTGAAATQGEIDANIRTFFPVVGDSPEVIQRKAQARAQAEQDMQIVAGRGASQIKPVNAAGNLTSSTNPPANSQGPQAGAVEEGYRFKGGNPADPANWEAQ